MSLKIKNMAHHETVRQEFSKQATFFGDKGLTLSSQEYLDWMVGILPLKPTFRVLDVAAGTAHLSRAIAPHVNEVVAIDMTPEMLEEAQKAIAKSGLQNIRLEEGDAQHLPYQADSFDMVVSRLALHHFEEPSVELGEMVRVCKPSHVVGILDLLAPEDETLRACYNHLEQLRDSSHTSALTHTQITTMMKDAGLKITRLDMRDITVDFQRWVEMTRIDTQTIATIRKALEQEMGGRQTTGMRPYKEDGVLKFIQVWSVVIGMKCSRLKV
jgi:ubiquinone/menaquinone biosynthesis C-methylase UbiE